MPCKTRFEWATTMSTREHPFLITKKKKIQHNYALAFNKHVYHFHIV